MTEYEQASLRLAEFGVWIQAATVGVAVLALIAAVVGGWTIWLQLRASQWHAMLQFEMEMHARARDLSELAAEININRPEELKLLGKRKDALVEAYLNALDRFASSILHGQFPDRKLRPDYRGYIETALRESADKFGPGTRFKNVLKLHDKWSS